MKQGQEEYLSPLQTAKSFFATDFADFYLGEGDGR